MSTRTVAVWPHATRADATETAAAFVRALADRGVSCVTPDDDRERLRGAGAAVGPLDAGERPELAVIFGGDGSILRAAEWALPREVPLLGVNMGHIGFLAELEEAQLDQLVTAVADRGYQVERRLALAVALRDSSGAVVWQSEAVNEVSLEKSARERMIEALVSIDGLPLSRWGADGVLVATPTGSTAYAFSAGGPVVWPDVEALLIVPLSAHALFARPVVIGPGSRVEIRLVDDSVGSGVVWCDGRRTTPVEPGSVIEVCRSERTLLLARIGEQPFTSRLVRKFGLRIEGWRGASEA